MLDRQYQNDYHYLQARHQERIQASEELRVMQQNLSSAPKLKDRIFLALGDKLIAWGQKLKCEAEFDELSQECA